ncbi:bcl-2-related ovarian killer protein isoform X2 [Pseudorca crassidens]|uniref:bcl-2-related ovarian killer protein isoform X2 n=1 Tax=Pseudorca crassidens TaxID=82174 RepID=UPI00352FE1B6
MEVLRRSSVFAAEIMDAFDRSPTDKELVAQAKALGREFVHARLLRAGLAWSAPERAAPAPGGRLAEVCTVLLRLADELELIRPSVYRNVARQLNIPLQSETVVTDAFLAVAAQIVSAEQNISPRKDQKTHEIKNSQKSVLKRPPHFKKSKGSEWTSLQGRCVNSQYVHERLLSIISHQGNTHQTTTRCHLAPTGALKAKLQRTQHG